ncbi:MAG TPA: hypothetical protein VGQ17_17545 [Gemmatimonadales bacterium]|nr:hypothetical protein [Gemmatimonadales bacterium]
MENWLRRLRGAVGMGLTWAAGWALAGVLIGVSSKLLPGLPWDSFFEVFDAPLPALAIPGFFGGVLFSTVLGIAARHRSFAELSLPRFAAWGAAGGLLLSLVPAALVAVGLASLGRPDFGLWHITAAISGPLTLLSAVSASATLMLARMAEGRELLEASEDAAEVGLAEGEAQELLGGGD